MKQPFQELLLVLLRHRRPELQPFQYIGVQRVVADKVLILTDENYLGNSIHNKTSVKSFKLKKQTRNPTSEWVRVEGTHEAIISRDVFDQVQKRANELM